MKIRIGKDINIRWEILTDGEPRPLEGRTLALYIQDYTRRRTEIPFTRDGNALLVSLRAAQLTRLGEYVLTLVENEDEEGQTAVDAKPAFTLVEYSTEEDESPAAPELDVEQVRLDTANLVRTAGGIQPEELFAGKPVVMEKGDIVPVMRDGQLRPVRVPGQLHGKYKGVIHKAVPLRPRAGMAYIFRGNCVAFKTNSDIFYDHATRLIYRYKRNSDISPNKLHVLWQLKGDASNYFCSFEEIPYNIQEVDIRVIYIYDSLPLLHEKIGPDRTSVLYIESDGESTNSDEFRFRKGVAISNILEMASENYMVSGNSILFTGMPIFHFRSFLKKNDIMSYKRKAVRWYYKKLHRYVVHKGWRRILNGDKKWYEKIHPSINYRIVRYETKNKNRRSIHFLELRGSELYVRFSIPK